VRVRAEFQAMLWASILSLPLCALTACHSHHVDSTIENQTGAMVQLLEVDYPNASFGTDSLSAGAAFHYRFQIQGGGEIKLQYTVLGGHPVQITGPALSERQEGSLRIVLLPDGQAAFYPQLTPGS
jgi:hypothetical protein